MKKKILNILLIILVSLITIALIFIMIYKKNLKRSYKDFVNISETFCLIPGLDTEFVPQGISYNEKHNLILVVGYNSDKTPSPIFLLDTNGNIKKKITIKNTENKDYTGHAGGIISFNDIIFVSSGKKVYKLDMNKVLLANDNDSIIADAVTSVDTDGATMFVYNNYLFVTEFYEDTKYQTETSHHIKTPSGGTNKALVFAYEIDENNISGLKSNEPKLVLSIPEKVQGLLVKDDEMILSTSFGRYNDSYIYKYKNILNKDTTNTFKYNDLELPLYIMDKADITYTLLAPPMSEGITFYNDCMLVLFESAASKYRLTTRCKTEYIWQIKSV